MSLSKNLTEEDLALLDIIEDPVWFGEMSRNTADFSMHREAWPKPEKKFEYRWYQKDLLSDKSPFIILTAGRAVGKCNPMFSRIYTIDGYKYVADILKAAKPYFIVYALDDNGKLVQRRANISKNGKCKVFRVTSESGMFFDGTPNHPVLTQRGFVRIDELKDDDTIAIVNSLPWESTRKSLHWLELRWFGYASGTTKTLRPEMYMNLSYSAQVAEMQAIAKYFDCHVIQDSYGFKLATKRGLYKHYVSNLLSEMKCRYATRQPLLRVPDIVKEECLENIKIYLESFFSLWSSIDTVKKSITVSHTRYTFLKDIQELLLRFSVKSFVKQHDDGCNLTLQDADDFYRFFHTFKLPGIGVNNIPLPSDHYDDKVTHSFERIVSIEDKGIQPTFAIFVHDDHNYICDNVIVHNSLVLEDKIIYESVNYDIIFPETKEQAVATANEKQLMPLWDKLEQRLTNSKFYREYLRGGGLNKSKGTLTIPIVNNPLPYKISSRIAGSKGENNMVGMHVARIKVDEIQLFPWASWVQLMPTLNQWEDNTQVFCCGVPNGIRDGSVAFFLDQKSAKYKKYRIPSHNNPYYFRHKNIEDIKEHAGENTDAYQTLVLGRHGSAAYAVIPHESIVQEPFELFNYTYSVNDKAKGRSYQSALGLPRIPEKNMKYTTLAIDTGYTDPTIIQLIALGDDDKWRTLARWKLSRIQFPEQVIIIDWIATHYNIDFIGIDAGAGGGGTPIMQELFTDKYKSKRYDKRILGVLFNDMIVTGLDPSGKELKIQMKSYGGQQLAKMIAEKELVFSEMDFEGISQLERVSYQKRSDGSNSYYVMSEKGNGASKDDHIFASYVVFIALMLRVSLNKVKRRKLFSARW